MSFANQPSRLMISSDDLTSGNGNNFTCILPEPIVGAIKVDLLRAVVPNTLYNFPAYQANFYYFRDDLSGVQTLTINTNQYFDGFVTGVNGCINGLIDYLNTFVLTSGISFSYNAVTSRITLLPRSGAPYAVRPALRTEWLSKFALNTRLGFESTQSPVLAFSVAGNIMPNLIRSKVIYVLCNLVANDSITTDGLRTAIAKMPVNSVYGGLTIYQPPKLNFCRLVQNSGYNTIQITLLDDQYQPYGIQTDEFCEFEIAFIYKETDIIPSMYSSYY